MNTTYHPLGVSEKSSVEFVRARDVAARYQVTERAVALWAERGVIPHIKIGGKTLRFNLADVIAKLEGGVK